MRMREKIGRSRRARGKAVGRTREQVGLSAFGPSCSDELCVFCEMACAALLLVGVTLV